MVDKVNNCLKKPFNLGFQAGTENGVDPDILMGQKGLVCRKGVLVRIRIDKDADENTADLHCIDCLRDVQSNPILFESVTLPGFPASALLHQVLCPMQCLNKSLYRDIYISLET